MGLEHIAASATPAFHKVLFFSSKVVSSVTDVHRQFFVIETKVSEVL